MIKQISFPFANLCVVILVIFSTNTSNILFLICLQMTVPVADLSQPSDCLLIHFEDSHLKCFRMSEIALR